MSEKTSSLLCTSDAAKELGYTLQHTRLLIRQGRLRAVKIGRDWVIERGRLSDFSARYRKKYSAG
jgi:excisionase family DNA binding protein